jgi:two-component system C4-dicarboxylate transport sensor histidine kinase DctB
MCGGRTTIRIEAFLSRLIFWGCIAGLFLAILSLTDWWAERAAVNTLRQRVAHRLDLYATSLEGELAKYDYLPTILPLAPTVIELLRRPEDGALAAAVNHYLEQLNQRARSTAVYVLDLNGTVVAASNWNEPISFIGMDLSYRPYFQDTLRRGSGRFYGIGTTSGEPGYFFAHAIRFEDQLLGVATVKVSLNTLEQTWVPGSERVYVTDTNGVIILASVPEWKFKATGNLPEDQLAQLNAARQYDRVTLEPIRFVVRRGLDDNASIIGVGSNGPDQPEFLTVSKDLPEITWRITMIADLDDVGAITRNATIVAGLGYGCVLLTGLYLEQRRRTMRQKLAAKETLQRAHDQLERRVDERTADLITINERLRQEVDERERAERELREALDELVQAGKLAVLGQMAAGITHELNQPLATLRILSDNTAIFLQRAQPEQAKENLKLMAEMIDRMGQITGQLRTFARKSPNWREPVPVHRCIANALFLLDERLCRHNITVDFSGVPENVTALCNANRLEQVLVNLFGNAIDAMADVPERRLTVTAEGYKGGVCIRVRDSGTGISDTVMPRLFEPFFTTKEAGQGLGLGLVISAGIVREFGGTLKVENAPGNGAEFTVELPGAVDAEGAEPCQTP